MWGWFVWVKGFRFFFRVLGVVFSFFNFFRVRFIFFSWFGLVICIFLGKVIFWVLCVFFLEGIGNYLNFYFVLVRLFVLLGASYI